MEMDLFLVVSTRVPLLSQYLDSKVAIYELVT
jgi:hypothetical protein